MKYWEHLFIGYEALVNEFWLLPGATSKNTTYFIFMFSQLLSPSVD